MSNSSYSNLTGPTFLFAKSLINKYTDALFLYLVLPMASFGTVFNLLSFVILCKRSFNEINLFKYFRVYIFSSLIASSSLIFVFYMAQYSLYKLALTYSARIFTCEIVQKYGIALIFLYENTLEIFINLERALCFSNDYKRLKKISPYIICLSVLPVCILIHSPNFFLFDITQDYELPIVLRSCKPTQFAFSSFGKLVLIISYTLEGPVIVLLQIITNVISVISFRRFIKRKTQLQAQTAQTSTRNAANDINEKIERRLLKMVGVMISFSFIIHLVQIANQFILYIYQLSPTIGAWFGYTTIFVWALKNLVNIFFLYFGNTQFRKALNIFKNKKQLTRQQPTQQQIEISEMRPQKQR